MAKKCNEKRVMFEACRWAERGVRVNSISPGIIVTPLAIDEFNGPRGDLSKTKAKFKKQSLNTIIKDCFYLLKFYHLLNLKSINSNDFFEK